MRIKPDIGSLPCLLTHFKVSIRVLLITHKDPGNLTSLTFFLPRSFTPESLYTLTEQLTLAPCSILVLSTINYLSGSTPISLDKRFN